MKALATSVIAACLCVVPSFAQQGVGPSLRERITSFASEEGRALRTLDPMAEMERSCDMYARIEVVAHDLAVELRATKPEMPYPSAEIAMAYALAAQPNTDAQCSQGYIVMASMIQSQATLANTSPTGTGTLMDVSDLARQASKAKTAKRLARVHKRLSKRLAELEELMAAR